MQTVEIMTLCFAAGYFVWAAIGVTLARQRQRDERVRRFEDLVSDRQVAAEQQIARQGEIRSPGRDADALVEAITAAARVAARDAVARAAPGDTVTVRAEATWPALGSPAAVRSSVLVPRESRVPDVPSDDPLEVARSLDRPRDARREQIVRDLEEALADAERDRRAPEVVSTARFDGIDDEGEKPC